MITLLHTFQPSPILATFGPFVLRWYGLCLALGALAGYLVVRAKGRRLGWSPDAVTSLFFFTLLFGFLGARIYHVLNEPSYYWQHPIQIVEVWKGGLAIHGGLIAGALTLLWFARRWRIPLARLTDAVAPAIAIGQAFGRWGNFFNQELFGRPTTLPWGIPIDPANRPAGYETVEFFHPTFLYESLWALLVFFVLTLTQRSERVRRFGDGIVTWLYLGFAALGRFGTELLRIDDTPHIVGVRLPLIVSAILLVVAIGGLWYCAKRATVRRSM